MSGWTWNGYLPSVCQNWGNGIKEGTEACDDGNTDIIFDLIKKIIGFILFKVRYINV